MRKVSFFMIIRARGVTDYFQSIYTRGLRVSWEHDEKRIPFRIQRIVRLIVGSSCAAWQAPQKPPIN